LAATIGFGERIEHVTAPDIAHAQVVAQQTFARDPNFSTTARDAVLSGWMKAFARCRPSSPKQKFGIVEAASVAMPCRWRGIG
jgi:hypothetical protein